MEPLDQESYYDGTHWTGWSQNYGCPNSNPTPFGTDGATSVTSFCRARGLGTFSVYKLRPRIGLG